MVFAGGGTGGHLYPGIAVARELLARVPDARVTFVGTSAGIESRVIPREGFTLDVIRSAGLKGKSVGQLLGGFPGANDGTVALSETAIDGAADSLVVRTTHMGLLFSAPVAQALCRFLGTGRFEVTDAAP